MYVAIWRCFFLCKKLNFFFGKICCKKFRKFFRVLLCSHFMNFMFFHIFRTNANWNGWLVSGGASIAHGLTAVWGRSVRHPAVFVWLCCFALECWLPLQTPTRPLGERWTNRLHFNQATVCVRKDWTWRRSGERRAKTWNGNVSGTSSK